MLRIGARLALVAVLAAVLVPLDQPESWTTPVTLSETLDGLPVADAGRAGDAVHTAGAPDADDAAQPAAPAISTLVEAPIAFSVVGFTAPAHAGELAVRTSMDGENWTDWEPAAYLDVEDGPDPGSEESRSSAAGRHTEPVWVGEARHLQLQVADASPEDVEVTLIDSMHLNDGPVERHTEPAVGSPADAEDLQIISRAQWGADESLSRSTRAASEVHMGIVHHTAHSSSASVANGYSRDEAPGVVRAMYRYHTETLGWADIGYNVIIDRYGRIYEGRKGGFTEGIIGAHAAGNNTGSFGVSVIGNFIDQQAPAAAIESLTEVIAIKSAIHGIDPEGFTDQVGDGTWRPTIVGHRDVGQTSCPGRIQDLLPQIREDARETAVRFPDVDATSPHRGSVLALADAGVTEGCELNLYCPSETLTRAQAASFMLRSFELDPIPGTHFPDVPAEGVHAAAINKLAELEWLKGYPDGTFRPYQQLTRGQLATLLARSLDTSDEVADADSGSDDDSNTRSLADLIAEMDAALEEPDPEPDPYPDVPSTSTHYDGIMALAAEGVRGDCDGQGNFCPNDPVKRDSTATFVYEVRKVHGLD